MNRLAIFTTTPLILAACQSASPTTNESAAVESSDPPVLLEQSDSILDYLLERYDANRDQAVSAAEYTRHDGQFERWDTNSDGQLNAEDWTKESLSVMPQIMQMQRMDVLGRYFQTDENEPELLTIDELAAAFFEYDEAGNADEFLTQSEFEASSESRAIPMPGDGSMMKQSYTRDREGWELLSRHYDEDRDGSLTLPELTALFEELNVYEFRFDQVRFDDGEAGAHFESMAYRTGLPVGSDAPDVVLTSLADDSRVSLRSLTGIRPVALVFGSYT